MERYVLGFGEIGRGQVGLVGGKGAGLAELARVEGVRVPAGFCLTTAAFRRVVAAEPAIAPLLERLSGLAVDDRAAIRRVSGEIRRAIEAAAIPADLEAAIAAGLAALGPEGTYAVRSSATAEDLPGRSSAGQHDSYLNVAGRPALLRQVGRCWASLFTERAVTYRLRSGVDQGRAEMAVVVQRMVPASASGVLFTADPVTSNRRICAIEATPGLAEALVSGRVTPDIYRVRVGELVERVVAAEPVLSDDQAVRLAGLGRLIEVRLGAPQDVEWCLAGEDFQIVQSRPITTLFPIPAATDGDYHVYVSVGHQQMMTDAIRPLGISVWQLTAGVPMHTAGSRLFVDVGRSLASPAAAAVIDALGRSDPLIGDALQTIVDRDQPAPVGAGDAPATPPAGPPPDPIATDPAIVAELIAANRASVEALARDIQGRSGAALLDFILDDLAELKRLLFEPRSHQAIMAGIEAVRWLDQRMEAWLGETHAADLLTQAAPGNITSEMGLALLDVADVIRPHPQVVGLLERVERDPFLDRLATVSGGAEARAAILAYLDRYGMRCAGEIDITRPRWSERPATLVPLILVNVRRFPPGEHRRRLERGRRQAEEARGELLGRLRGLPGGGPRADQAGRMIDRLRTFIGYREYPKYGMICRYAIYRRALMEEADRLVAAGVLGRRGDIHYLTFAELHQVVRSRRADEALIRARRDAFTADRALTPPRVFTSDGEVVAGRYRRGGRPAGALPGLPVSAGTVEGRARVVADIARADLEPGDILVTTCTDPSWTPLFVAIAGLVTEVGGAMTHGAVIAREYGLPAVVGVERATSLIADGRRIRVHGTEGYVELLAG